ncbi:MAG: efflux RND transporter periplasmic adaptor subunit [Chitinophagaceae bacterium]|nr:MAG: efflux RND transporter periplasmic adaptor subunit [Chitinophagaceae bacterium]
MYNRILIFICILTFVSCSGSGEGNKESTAGQDVASEKSDEGSSSEVDTVSLTDAQAKTGGIVAAFPLSEKLNTILSVNGSIDVPPQNVVSVSFPFGGFLKSTRLLPGMHVSKGEVIGIMEDQSLVQLQQDYLVAAAKLGYLKLEYDRQKTLQENNVNSAKTFQQAEAEYNSQKVFVSGYAQKLKMIHIDATKLTSEKISSTVAVYSPIDGFVSSVNVNIGKFVNPTDVLFELINPADMHAALVVFEKDIAKVRAGQHVRVSLVDEPGKEYLCEVILVTRNVNEDRTGMVHCHFEQMPKSLMPGMFLNAKILLTDVEALTVPEDAVVRYGNKEFVLQEQNAGSYKLVAVSTGIREKGKVQLNDSTGVLSSKKVIVSNAYAVLSKMKNKG